MTTCAMRPWLTILFPIALLAEGGAAVDSAYLESLLSRLLVASGKGGHDVRIRIVDAHESNAYAREKVIIMTRKLGQRLQGNARKKDALAAIIAHELAHVLLGHKQSPAMGTEEAHSQAESSRAREWEADTLALLTLKKAGYPPDSLLHALKAMATKETGNPYMRSHPSLHARLARLQTPEAQDHQRLADLELALGAIEVGGLDRLRNSTRVLERELSAGGRNLFFEQALALARHRLWEASASVDELIFKTAIASRYFDDAMLLTRSSVRGPSRRIPGNLAYYRAALVAYDRLEQPDALTCSAKLALKSYDPSLRNKADCPLEPANQSTLAQALTLNNYGIVYYQRGENQQSLAAFEKASRLIFLYHEESMEKTPYKTARELSRAQALQQMDPQNAPIRFAALFNLGKWYHLNGQKDRSRDTWQNYLQNHDRTSAWARHAELSMR